MELSEQEIQRRNDAEELRKLGINPYPAAMYDVNANTQEIKEEFEKDNTLFQDVKDSR
jgi:lysyl-tRNA synthetase class 2